MVVSSFLIVSLGYAQQNKFKLKPDAKGKLCLNCHENFKEKLNLPFIHAITLILPLTVNFWRKMPTGSVSNATKELSRRIQRAPTKWRWKEIV
jgi:hypothetical protein